MRKILKKLLCFIFALCLAGMIAAGFAPKAEAAVDTLTVKAGYFGLPYAEKAVMSVETLESLGAYTAFYTMNTNGGFLGCADAYGVPLYDIMDYSDVNVGMIDHFNFYASDNYYASASYYPSRLFGNEKYAFPLLPQYYSKADGVTDPEAVWASAESVVTMIALEDNYSRVSDFSEYVPSPMTSTHRFRLMIGQDYPGQVVASDSIYNIHTILITYAGSPEISTDSEVTVSLDEDLKLDISVSSADSEVSDLILQGLKYKSNDPSVVKVDSTGKLTAVGKGEAEITIYFEPTDIDASGISKTVKVTVGEDNDTGGGGGGGGSGTGLGDGEGSGDGGSGAGSGTGTGTGSETGSGTGTGTGSGQETGGTGGGSGSVSGGGSNNSSQTTPENNNGTVTDDRNGASSDVQNSSAPQDNNDSGSSSPSDSGVQEQETVMYITDTPDKLENITTGTKSSHTLAVRRLLPSGSSSSSSTAAGTAGGSSGGSDGGSAALGLVIEKNQLLWVSAIAAILLFLSGGLSMYIRFRKEIQE